MPRKKAKPVEDQTTLEKPVAKPATAQKLVAALRKSGFIGMWKDRSDIDDSREFARKLRERAPTNTKHFKAIATLRTEQPYAKK